MERSKTDLEALLDCYVKLLEQYQQIYYRNQNTGMISQKVKFIEKAIKSKLKGDTHELDTAVQD